MQSTVNRNYTTGFPGEVRLDGPLRAKPGMIVSPTVGADPAASTNRVSRAFGFSADLPAMGSTLADIEAQVVVGGASFYGVLFHPKHYALYGTQSGGPLAASLDLPQYANAEFADMAILNAELFNEQTAVKAMAYGDQVAFVPNNITVANNPQALPYGALLSVPAGQAAPTGMVLIPGARVVNAVSIGASAAGAPVSTYTVIQLTQ